MPCRHRARRELRSCNRTNRGRERASLCDLLHRRDPVALEVNLEAGFAATARLDFLRHFAIGMDSNLGERDRAAHELSCALVEFQRHRRRRREMQAAAAFALAVIPIRGDRNRPRRIVHAVQGFEVFVERLVESGDAILDRDAVIIAPRLRRIDVEARLDAALHLWVVAANQDSDVRSGPRQNFSEKRYLDITPRLDVRLRTFPRHDARLRTFPRHDARLRTSPRLDVRLRTFPRHDARLRTSPRHDVRLRTFPRHDARLRTSPRLDVRLRTSPRHDVRLRTFPRHDVRLRTSPRHDVRLRTFPRHDARLRTSPRLDVRGDASAHLN